MRTVWAASGDVEKRPQPRLAFWRWQFLGEHEESHLNSGDVIGGPAASSGALWGIPVFPVDRDRAVRRLPRRWYEREMPRRTFAGTVADLYCERSHACAERASEHSSEPPHGDIFVSYGSFVSRTPDYYVRDLFECEQPVTPGQPCRRWRPKPESNEDAETNLPGSVVLIGGTFGASRDFFDTPSGERTSGLIVNAHAVAAEIHGPVISEFSPLVTLSLDVLVGLWIAYLFGPTSAHQVGRVLQRALGSPKWLSADRAEWRVLASLFAVIVLAVLSYPLLHWTHIIWFSWIGMILVGVSWHLVFEMRHTRIHTASRPGSPRSLPRQPRRARSRRRSRSSP
jgi:hypothetical protein